MPQHVLYPFCHILYPREHIRYHIHQCEINMLTYIYEYTVDLLPDLPYQFYLLAVFCNFNKGLTSCRPEPSSRRHVNKEAYRLSSVHLKKLNIQYYKMH